MWSIQIVNVERISYYMLRHFKLVLNSMYDGIKVKIHVINPNVACALMLRLAQVISLIGVVKIESK